MSTTMGCNAAVKLAKLENVFPLHPQYRMRHGMDEWSRMTTESQWWFTAISALIQSHSQNCTRFWFFKFAKVPRHSPRCTTAYVIHIKPKNSSTLPSPKLRNLFMAPHDNSVTTVPDDHPWLTIAAHYNKCPNTSQPLILSHFEFENKKSTEKN